MVAAAHYKVHATDTMSQGIELRMTENPWREQLVYFVHRGLSDWQDLDQQIERHGLDQVLLGCRNGRDAWVISTYTRLRRRGYPVKLVDHFVPGALCIAHRDDIASAPGLWRSFNVAIRADRERTFISDLEVVQSPAVVDAPGVYYLPHWPQPALIPRDPERGDRFERLGFFGPRKNLAACFRTPEFAEQLQALGVELVIQEEREQWHDYSDIDAVIAVRDGLPYFLAGKPPAKLFNAWRAGCLAFVGSEPAFHHYRQSEDDFIHVINAEELLDRIRVIKETPGLYDRLRLRAEQLGATVDVQHIEDTWIAFLESTALSGYNDWCARSLWHRYIRSLLSHGYRLFRRFLRGNLYTRGYDVEGNPLGNRRTFKRRLALIADGFLSAWDRRQRARNP